MSWPSWKLFSPRQADLVSDKIQSESLSSEGSESESDSAEKLSQDIEEPLFESVIPTTWFVPEGYTFDTIVWKNYRY